MEPASMMAALGAGAGLMTAGMHGVRRAYASRRGRRLLLGLALCTYAFGSLSVAIVCFDLLFG